MNALHAGLRAAAVLFTFALLSAHATAQTALPAARSELAPGGKLRVGLLVRNPVFVSKDGTAGDMQGIAVDLGRELAKRLGVAFEPVRYQAIEAMLAGAKGREWDVAFLGFDPARTADMDFSAPYLEVGNTYLVPAGSPIKSFADADKAGYRLVVAQRSITDLHLSKTLKQAELVRVAVVQTSGELLTSGKAHAVVGNHVTLAAMAEKVPGSRLLEGSFYGTAQALGIAKGRPAGSKYAGEFIENAKATGFVQQAIQRSSLRGLTVAAPASGK
jgi:polar amino acid transport system substrate-binding protein